MYVITTIILPFLIAFNLGVIFAGGNWSRKVREGFFLAVLATVVVQLLNLYHSFMELAQ